MIPLKELQLAEADFERARSERDRALARERLYGGSAAIDQQYRLTAPVAGVVVDRRVTPGQEVRPDQGTEAPLFVIDPTRLWIQLDVPEILSQEVQKGEAVRVSVPALPGEVFTARVEYIADYIDPQTRNGQGARHGRERRAAAEGRDVRDGRGRGAAVGRAQGAEPGGLPSRRHPLRVRRGVAGHFVRRPLRAEEATLGFMRVLDGLRKGDRVVSDGALLLQQLIAQKATAPRSPPARGAPAPSSSSGAK